DVENLSVGLLSDSLLVLTGQGSREPYLTFMALAVSAISGLFIGPLPAGNVFSIDAELVGVILGSDLFVEQGIANTGAGDAETGHSIDSVNGQAEAVSLVTNGQFKWGIDVTLLLVATHVDVVLTGAAVG